MENKDNTFKEHIENIKFNLRYYFIVKPRDFWYDLKYFLKNLWRFRKQLWSYRSYDSCFNLKLFAESLEWLAKSIENGHEERKSATKKVKAIRELKSLIEYMYDDSEYETFGFDDNNNLIHLGSWETLDDKMKIYNKNKKKTFDRIYQIMYGQTEYWESKNKKDWYKDWVEWFDGTGYEGWWD